MNEHRWSNGEPSNGSDGLPFATSKTLECKQCGFLLTARMLNGAVCYFAVGATEPFDFRTQTCPVSP